MMDVPVVIITGASRGLGSAIARKAAEMGASVVLAARSFDQLHAEAEEIRMAGGRALPVRADISRADDCQEIVRQTLEHFGSIDALVNNGGVIEPISPLAQANLEEWDQNWAVNLRAPVILMQLSIPSLRQRHGRIVNLTSGTGVSVVPGWGAYSSSKAALNHLTRIMAEEEPDITSLAVRPGIVDTLMQAAIREKGKNHMGEPNYNRLYGLYEKGELLPPDVPGRAIAALALYAPQDWSGEILSWDDERAQQLVKDVKQG